MIFPWTRVKGLKLPPWNCCSAISKAIGIAVKNGKGDFSCQTSLTCPLRVTECYQSIGYQMKENYFFFTSHFTICKRKHCTFLLDRLFQVLFVCICPRKMILLEKNLFFCWCWYPVWKQSVDGHNSYFGVYLNILLVTSKNHVLNKNVSKIKNIID